MIFPNSVKICILNNAHKLDELEEEFLASQVMSGNEIPFHVWELAKVNGTADEGKLHYQMGITWVNLRTNQPFLVSCKLTKHSRRFSCVSNFKMLTYARLLSLNSLNEAPWCSPFPLKFQSSNLQNCNKYCSKLIVCVFPQKLLPCIIFGQVHCCEVTLLNKYNKPRLQKSETEVFKQKQFHKKLVQTQRDKQLGRFEIKLDNV